MLSQYGTTGTQLDALARNALWANAALILTTRHGSWCRQLSVGARRTCPHQQGRPRACLSPRHDRLKRAWLLSTRPFMAFASKTLLLVKTGAKAKRRRTAPSCLLETLTFAPIDKNLIDASLLTKAELIWLDAYHKTVWQKIGVPGVDAATKPWLKQACEPFTNPESEHSHRSYTPSPMTTSRGQPQNRRRPRQFPPANQVQPPLAGKPVAQSHGRQNGQEAQQSITALKRPCHRHIPQEPISSEPRAIGC